MAALGAPEMLEIADGDERLTCDLAEVQPLACAVRRVSLATTRWANASIASLKQVSDDLSARLTYLLEPVGPVEVDPCQCVVQMRSNPPQKDDDGTRYYELLVSQGGAITLSRYQKQPRNVRQLVPAIMTQEVLVRLVSDFSAAVARK